MFPAPTDEKTTPAAAPVASPEPAQTTQPAVQAQPEPTSEEPTATTPATPTTEPASAEPVAAPAAPAAPEPPKPLTMDDLVSALKVLTPAPAPEPAPAAPAPTAEEIERAYNYWQPDEEIIKSLQNSENPALAKQALIKMRDGLAKQNATIMQAYVAQVLAPLQQVIQQIESDRVKAQFYNKYEDLKPYEKIVDVVATNVKPGKSQEETLEAVASKTRELIKQLVVTGATPTPSKPAKPTSQMPTLNSGGQTGERPKQKSQPTGPYAAALKLFESPN